MTIIDESSKIKNHDVERTKKCWLLGEDSPFRLILTGTSVTQGIQDLFSQMFFVDPCAIGEVGFYSFRNKYCVMGGFENNKIVGYDRVEELMNKIRPFCDVVRKGDMKDLPPKTYQVRRVRSTAAQIKACKELAKEMSTELHGVEITIQNALEGLLRFQQISGGHMPDGTPLPTNPKMEELIEVLDDFDGKAIIWARYLPEIKAIRDRLEKKWPGSTLMLCGEVPPAERQPMVDLFQSDSGKRFFVSNQATGGVGLTLTAATLSVYFSNTFSLEDRLQSEDRNHRIGQLNAVTYVDLISDLKVDSLVMAAIVNKKDLADYVSSELKLGFNNLVC
jgi:SNF2 family DNA or RNA helicase